MTSRRFSERTAKTETPDFSLPAARLNPRRSSPTVRRGLKKRSGVLPSFGDMILPVVGVFAVVLLVIFGRQFFLNGLKSSPGIASTRAYAEAPAILAELEKKIEPEQEVKIPDPVSEDLIAKSEDKEEDLFALAVAVQTQKPQPQNNETKKAAAPAQTAKKTSTSNSASSTAAKKAATPAKTQPQKTQNTGTVSDKQWRVQVGAYTSRAGAKDAADKIKKAGYNAMVYSNPASKHFKVWVAGGKDKKAADNVVKAMQKLGYKGSFSFPPAK